MTTWEHASSQLGDITEATRQVAKTVFDAAVSAGVDVWYLWGIGQYPEHNSRLAVDFMIRNEAGGDFVRDYIWTNRARFGLQHVIWEQHITSTVVSPGVRVLMDDRGDPTSNHYDHVHMLRFNTPLGVSSRVRRPWPAYMPPTHFFGLITGPENSHGGWYAREKPDVKAIQQRLIQLGHVPGISDLNDSWADGLFEQETANAVARWQHMHYPNTTYFGEVWSDDWDNLFTY